MDSARFKTNHTTTASSTSGMVFGWTVALCACAALLMLTVKLGMVLFG